MLSGAYNQPPENSKEDNGEKDDDGSVDSESNDTDHDHEDDIMSIMKILLMKMRISTSILAPAVIRAPIAFIEPLEAAMWRGA